MTRFKGGPLHGHMLELARSPQFLRGTRNPETGAVDALDLLTDSPRQQEEVTVYRLVRSSGSVHLDSQDRRTGRRTSRTMALADYEVLPASEQPGDAVTRDTVAWRAWCEERTEGD